MRNTFAVALPSKGPYCVTVSPNSTHDSCRSTGLFYRRSMADLLQTYHSHNGFSHMTVLSHCDLSLFHLLTSRSPVPRSVASSRGKCGEMRRIFSRVSPLGRQCSAGRMCTQQSPLLGSCRAARRAALREWRRTLR